MSDVTPDETGHSIVLAGHDRRAEVKFSIHDLEGAVVRNFSLETRAGEIVGLTGLVGDGLERLCQNRLYSNACKARDVTSSTHETMGPLMASVMAFNGVHGDAWAGVLTGWYQASVTAMKADLCEGAEPGEDGHGGEIETSRMLAARPELVHMNRASTYYPHRRRLVVAHDAYPLAGGGLYRPMHDYRDLLPMGSWETRRRRRLRRVIEYLMKESSGFARLSSGTFCDPQRWRQKAGRLDPFKTCRRHTRKEAVRTGGSATDGRCGEKNL